MKQKKIRGHKRRLKQIEHWKQFHLSVNLEEVLSRYSSHYAKIRIFPWNGFTGGNSIIPQPYGATKLAMLAGLLEIHAMWKEQLDALNIPSYLKIWLFEPHFSESEVVCAIGDKLHDYDNMFLSGDDNKQLNTSHYGMLKQQIEQLQWKHCIDEEHVEDNRVGDKEEYATLKDYYETRQWFKLKMKKPHRITAFDQPTEDYSEYYSFKKGYVWVGE